MDIVSGSFIYGWLYLFWRMLKEETKGKWKHGINWLELGINWLELGKILLSDFWELLGMFAFLDAIRKLVPPMTCSTLTNLILDPKPDLPLLNLQIPKNMTRIFLQIPIMQAPVLFLLHLQHNPSMLVLSNQVIHLLRNNNLDFELHSVDF